MSHFDRDPVSVASKEVHGPSFGMGTLGLVALLGLGAGTILGGVIMPFLRSSPPDQSQSQKLEATQETTRALLFSMYPQTIYAPVMEGSAPVSTGMSVEQYLAELEVRSSQAGLSATKSVERKGDNVEISFVFSDAQADNARTFPQSKIKTTHPKTLVLTFASGPLPGTIALQKTRADGRDRGAGATFVDFVSLGAMPPELAEGQFLTPRGIFEIKLTGDGVGAFLDGILVYPASPPKPGPVLAFPGSKPDTTPPTTGLPRRLALQSFQPAIGPLKDRLILVSSTTATDRCSAKAVILDTKRGTVIELAEPLKAPTVAVSNAKDALIFNGFCVPEPAPTGQSPDEVDSAQPVPPVTNAPKLEVQVSARYDLGTGELTWQRQTIAIAPPVSVLGGQAQTGVATPWRAQGNTRLASPLISGGALVSIACRPGGGVTLALSGLPAPNAGMAAGLRFSSGGGTAVAQMRWRESAGGYELDGAARPNEARAVLDRLRAGGPLTVSGSSGSKVIPAPGSAQVDRLVTLCGLAPVVAPTAPILAAPPPKTNKTEPVKPKPAVGVPPKAKTASPTTTAAVPKAQSAPPASKAESQPRPAPKAPVAPLPKPKPKPVSEAAPPRNE